nr:ubiquitin hydrolase [Tanacetum cinerariifolium]
MVKTSSSSENEPCYSKAWLAQVEERLAELRNRELKYCEKIRGLEFKTESSADCIESLKKDIEDMSWIGLPEFAYDTVTDYSRPSPAIESTSDDAQNKNPSVTETGKSSSSILSKPAVKFVKAADCTEVKTNKVEDARKSSVRYAELYRKTPKGFNVRGNQRNWNNLKSQQLGNNFMMKNKACFNCGDFDHLFYDCGLWVKKGRVCLKNNCTHKSMPPRAVVHKTVRPPMRTTRPNMNVAQPKRTSIYKPAHSYLSRPVQRKSTVRTQS